MKQKILSIVLAACVIFSMTMPVMANETGTVAGKSAKQTVAKTDGIYNATPVSLNKQYSGMLTQSEEADYYQFTMPSSGSINLKITAYMEYSTCYIYDVQGNEIYDSGYNSWNDTTKRYDGNDIIYLTKGTYYFCMEKRSDYTGSYNFKLNFKSSGESFTETGEGTNNSIETASKIASGKSYKGQIADNDDKDFYKLTVPSSGAVNLKLTAYIGKSSWYIYDSQGQEVCRSTYNSWNDTTKRYTANEIINLTKGTYYFCLAQCSEYYAGNYSFKLTFTSAKESFPESGNGTNNSMSSANKISIGKSYKGQIADNDDKDFYKFTLKSAATVRLKMTANIYRSSWHLYNSGGREIGSSTSNYWNDKTKRYTCNEKIRLSKGTYYFCMEEDDYSGNYTFSVSK